MKGLMKVFPDGSTMWREGRMQNYNVKDCLKKRDLIVRQARRMVHDKSEWQGFVRGNAWGIAQE